MTPYLSATRFNSRPANDPLADSFLPILCIWSGFLVYSFCHAPVPGVNEPHYLTKSLHHWDAEWCAGDFFLESSDAHLVFYRTLGVLTVWTSFATTALIGRMLSYLLLAFAWQRLCTGLTHDRWSGCLSSSVFLLLASIGNFSGEWLVGGVEAKVVSYGFVLAAFAALLGNQVRQAGFLLGCGVAMHPLVGLWSAVALTMSIVWSMVNQWRRFGLPTALTAAWTFVRSRDAIFSAVLFAGVSAFGVVPALASVLSTDPDLSFAANHLQVFYRLPHHLDPMAFKSAAYIGYAMLALVGWLLNRQIRGDAGLRLLSRIIVCSGIIALTGVLIGWGPRPAQEMLWYIRRMNLLKFYPFRLFDVMLPVLVSIQLALILSERRLLCVLLPSKSRLAICILCFGMALYLNAGQGSIDRMTDAQRADWSNVCRWMKDNSPRESLVLTPKENRTFKWLAARPEYVSFKDCPQDAAGIVEWNRRLRFLRDWGQKKWNGQSYSALVTRELHETTGITHIISRRFGPFEAPIVYRNATYRIYQINGEP